PGRQSYRAASLISPAHFLSATIGRQPMRTLKVILVLVFSISATIPMISPRLPWLTTAFAGSSPQKEKAAGQSATKGNGKQKQNNNHPPADPAMYVGSETCAQCHTNEAAHYAVTAHRKTNNDRYPVNERGCEACHGGAKNHVEFYKTAQDLIKDGKDAEAQALYADETKSRAAKMRSFTELSPSDATAVCLTCHEGTQGRSEERFNFRRSEHYRHGVSCLDCHSSHAPKRTEFLLRDSEPDTCYTCHAD